MEKNVILQFIEKRRENRKEIPIFHKSRSHKLGAKTDGWKITENREKLKEHNEKLKDERLHKHVNNSEKKNVFFNFKERNKKTSVHKHMLKNHSNFKKRNSNED